MDSFSQILLIHLFCTFAMTGVIWLVHLLTYPTMRIIPSNVYASYHQFHTARIGLVVVPLMLLEMVTAFALLLHEEDRLFYIANFFLLSLIWINTFFHSVPAHQKLIKIKDDNSLESLIRFNIIRTILWSIRSIFLIGSLIYGLISF